MKGSIKPVEGQMVELNVACAFSMKAEPIWERYIVVDLLATQFTAHREGDVDRVRHAFYYHHGDSWRDIK